MTNIVTEGSAAPIVTEQPIPSRVVDLSDKLTVINRALARTGNNPVQTPDDGSAPGGGGGSSWSGGALSGGGGDGRVKFSW